MIVREMSDEVLVYDTERHLSHCLNRSAALVWRSCDGKRGVDEITARLGEDLAVPATEEMVWLALESLEKAHLLQDRVVRPEGAARYSRREVARMTGRVGMVAALLPVAASIVAPTKAQAASGSNGKKKGHTDKGKSDGKGKGPKK
ncbi:MAG: PqqD family protein [Armatimonadota bacterium]